MKRLCIRLTMGAALTLAVALVGALPVGTRSIQVADASVGCPTTMHITGSTTVGPIAVGLEPAFVASWPGTTVPIIQNGSGNGIKNLNGITTIVPPANAPIVEIAQSSRPLSAAELAGNSSVSVPAGDVQTHPAGLPNFAWQIANDAFVMAVKEDPAMSFLWTIPRSDGGGLGLTKANITQIYNAGAAISSLKWSDLTGAGVGWSTSLIIPRARITGSGSQPDFISQIAVPAANEDATIVATALPRLTESFDMANAAEANLNQIVYTSLAQVASHPGMHVLGVGASAAGPFVIPTSVPDNISTYTLARQLFVVTKTPAARLRIGPDDTQQVRADDWVNFMRSPAGDALIAAEGYPLIPPAPVPPIPDWDVDLTGGVVNGVSIFDIGAVANHWGLTGCVGWVRSDVNNDGKVNLLDIGGVTSHWGQSGQVCKASEKCFGGIP